MIAVTIQDILALRPCQPTEYDPNAGYSEGKLQHLFGDRQSATLLEICDDERVPVKDRQWVLHKLLPDQIAHEAACRYAERALDRERTKGRGPDPRSWAAIAAKRMWLRGEISDGELNAAEAAAWDAMDAVSAAGYAWASDNTAAESAAESAAIAAVITAARTAAESAADASVWNATTVNERRWQLDTLREMIEEMED